MLEALWRWQARHARGGIDWLLVGFLLFAAVLTAWSQHRQGKQRAAFSEFHVLVAQGDAPGASMALERLRALGADPTRTRIAQARVDVLLGKRGAARDLLGGAGQAEELPPPARGELLLALGDEALAEGRFSEAREKYTAARTVIESTLVDLLLARVADRESRLSEESARGEAALRSRRDQQRSVFEDARARAEQSRRSWERVQEDRVRNAADQLRSLVDEALAAIQASQVDKAQLLLADARRHASALSPYEAPSKAQLALQAADRALSAVSRREQARAAMRVDNAALLGMSDEAYRHHQRYQQALQDRLRQAESEAQRTLDETRPLVRRFLDEALGLVGTSPSGRGLR